MIRYECGRKRLRSTSASGKACLVVLCPSCLPEGERQVVGHKRRGSLAAFFLFFRVGFGKGSGFSHPGLRANFLLARPKK